MREELLYFDLEIPCESYSSCKVNFSDVVTATMAKAPVIVAAVEIGTSKVTVLVGEVTPDSVNVIGRGSAPSAGAVVKGNIHDINKAARALGQALSQASESCGNLLLRSKLVTMVISGDSVRCSTGTGSAALPSGIVTEDKMEEARENAKVIDLDLNWEIMHSDDIFWKLDGRLVGNPLNQAGLKLVGALMIVQGNTSRIADFSNLMQNSELANAIPCAVYAPLCAKEVVLTPDELDDGAVLIDLGAGCTDYLVASGGGVLEAGTLQVGFDHVANDLAIGLGLPFAACRKLFENGTLKEALETRPHSLRIESAMGGEREIPLCHFETIIQARLEEIFEEVAKIIHVPGGGGAKGVLTGGGALYPPALDIFSRVFNIRCRAGSVQATSGNLDSPRYSAVWGALKAAADYQRENQEGLFQSTIEEMNNFGLYLPQWIGKLWKAIKF